MKSARLIHVSNDGTPILLSRSGVIYSSPDYVGALRMWPSQVLPEDGKWMVRNGDILDIIDYIELYEIIGSTYGGNGITNFALPDDRGLVERGIDLGRGYDTGRVFGSEEGDAAPNITGSIVDAIRSGNESVSGAFTRGVASSASSFGGGTYRWANLGFNVSSSNAVYGRANEVRQKTAPIFPS